jgi:hypothetical protein
MKKRFVAALLSGLGLFTLTAHAQSAAPDFPTATAEQPAASSEAGARRNTRATSEELARNQRRAAMSPEELKREQQLDILEARTGMATGNTSLGRSGPARQYDTRSGGFMVRQFKGRAGSGKERKGMTHMVGGSNPQGQRLIDKKHKKHFLFF